MQNKVRKAKLVGIPSIVSINPPQIAAPAVLDLDGGGWEEKLTSIILLFNRPRVAKIGSVIDVIEHSRGVYIQDKFGNLKKVGSLKMTDLKNGMVVRNLISGHVAEIDEDEWMLKRNSYTSVQVRKINVEGRFKGKYYHRRWSIKNLEIVEE